MGYRKLSAFAAGVLSILLIFTMFSSVGVFNPDYDAAAGIHVEANQDSSCSMNSSASAIPFANTRFASASGADVSEENKLFNIPILSVAGFRDVIHITGTVQPCAISDRRAEFLGRLLI